MKAQAASRLGALSAIFTLLLTSTAGGANPVTKTKTVADATAAVQYDNPEIQAVNDRVTKAESQLDLAKKQLSAARSLLKAAEADLKAARADRDSVALRYQAQGLAEQAGMPTQSGRAVAQALPKGQTADSGATPAPSATASQSNIPITAGDYNATQGSESDPAPPLQLR